mgnify:CR=1 FL=1
MPRKIYKYSRGKSVLLPICPATVEMLFVRHWFLGDSYTNEGWHKFMPDGKVEEYRIGDAYGGDDSKAWEL